MARLNDPTDEKELIADQLRRGVSASEVMAGVRSRAAGKVESRPGAIAELESIAEKAGARLELNTDSVVTFGKPARRKRVERRVDLAGQPIETAAPARELEVREVPYEVVAEWKGQAARDHVALGPTGNTIWYAAFRGKVIVGVAGLIRVGKVVRVKGVFVPRPLRGEGIGTVLTEAVIAAAPAECDVEVLAYNPAFYSGRGFDTQGEFRKGVTRLIFARSKG